MSYGVSAALQSAIFQTLTNDAALSALVGSAIYDDVPGGRVPRLYVSLGSETVNDASDVTGHGARHDIQLSVISKSAGFLKPKQVAAAISDALVDQSLTLSRGHLVSLNFLRAVARREEKGRQRRIDMTFRVRVEDDPTP